MILLLLLLLCLCTTATAQINYTADSMRVVDAEWRVDTLEGFYLKRYQFGEGSLFCSAQHLCVIEIPARSHRRLAFVADTLLTPVSAFAERNNAYAAINGSYFDMSQGNPVCYLRVNGNQIGENTPASPDAVNRKYYQHATIALNKGRANIILPDSNRRWEEQLPDSNIMTAGPMLIRKGNLVPQRDDRTFVTRRHNRTALGLKPDGTTLLVVADGRFPHQADGLTLNELKLIMQWLGCTDAINLDGGGSTTMYIRQIGGVVNFPSDNHQHDHEGERPVANALILL